MVDFSKFRYSDYLTDNYVSMLGEKGALDLMTANQNPLPLTIRTNTLKITHDKLKKKLEARGFKLRKHEYGEGFYVDHEPFNITATQEYAFGYFYIQDPNSWLPVLELAPKPEELILDMAAAPGGKSTHIAQFMKNKGTLVSLDINLERVKEMKSNFFRMGVLNSIIVRKDALKAGKLGLTYDKILLDAPCSGDGILRKDYESRGRITKTTVYRYTSIQKQLIKIAYDILEKGGTLVYSTCSTSPEEDEMIIDYALAQGFKIEDLKTKFGQPAFTRVFGVELNPELKKARRFWPHKDMTGFFIARLTK